MADTQTIREGFTSEELQWKDQNDLSFIDQMTGVFNRNAFEILGPKLFETSKRENLPLTMIFLDIDGLKNLNTKIGHSVADERIKDFILGVKEKIRPQDYIFKFGGDEYVLLFENIGQKKTVELIVPKIDRSLKDNKLEASLGIAERTDDDTLLSLLKRADGLMYVEKNKKNNG